MGVIPQRLLLGLETVDLGPGLLPGGRQAHQVREAAQAVVERHELPFAQVLDGRLLGLFVEMGRLVPVELGLEGLQPQPAGLPPQHGLHRGQADHGAAGGEHAVGGDGPLLAQQLVLGLYPQDIAGALLEVGGGVGVVADGHLRQAAGAGRAPPLGGLEGVDHPAAVDGEPFALPPIEADGLAHLARVHQQGLAVAAQEGLQGIAPGLVRQVHPVAEGHGGDAVVREQGDEAQGGGLEVALPLLQTGDTLAQGFEGPGHFAFLAHQLFKAAQHPLHRRRDLRGDAVHRPHDLARGLGPGRGQQAFVPAQQGRQALQGLDQGGVLEPLGVVEQAMHGPQAQPGLLDALVGLVEGLARRSHLGLEALPLLLQVGGGQTAVGLGQGGVGALPLLFKVRDPGTEFGDLGGESLQGLAQRLLLRLQGIEGRLLLDPAPAQTQPVGLLGALVAAIDEGQGLLALAGLAGAGLDVPVVVQGLLQGAHLDGPFLKDVAAHEVRDIANGGEGDGVAEGAQEMGRVQGAPGIGEQEAEVALVLAHQGVDPEGLAEAHPQLLPQPLPGLGDGARGGPVHQVRQDQIQAGGDETPVDHLLWLVQPGVQRQADAGGIPRLVVAEHQGQVADGLVPGAELL